MQMPAIFASRTVAVSGGPSWANDVPAPMRPAAPKEESVPRKRRRLCVHCITCLLSLDVREIRFLGKPSSSRRCTACARAVVWSTLQLPANPGAKRAPHDQLFVLCGQPGQLLREHRHALLPCRGHAGDVGAPEHALRSERI